MIKVITQYFSGPVRTLRLTAFCYILVAGTTVHAQKNLLPVSQSALTGISLPANTKEDKRMLMRAAAKSTMDLQAADSGLSLSDNYELFQLPLSPEMELASLLQKSLQDKGWKLAQKDISSGWAVAVNDARQVLLHLDVNKKEAWLYLAEISGKAKAVKPAKEVVAAPQPAMPVVPASPGVNMASPASKANAQYQFTTTNFDDGWTATEQPDWIELSKGNLTVLLHLSNAAIDMSSGQTTIVNANAWNVLIAPRYIDKREYFAFNGNMSYNRSSATSAVMTDKQGRQHYVVLFRRGGGLFLEFIAPDRASFEREFGMNISEANNSNLIWSDDAQWIKMDNMQGLNKFAVAAKDLPGQWTESTGAYAQMYYTGTGNYAGMNAVSNSAQFWLNADGTYRSEHKGASGMVGNQQFFQQEYKGKYSMNGNWELSLTNRYNGKTETFWCQFEVVRGGRILHLTDKASPGVQYNLVLKK